MAIYHTVNVKTHGINYVYWILKPNYLGTLLGSFDEFLILIGPLFQLQHDIVAG